MNPSAIILAAGANTRLKGIVPSFRKPLLLMNGRPLIQHALQFAYAQCVTRIVIVASPHNVADLVSVTPVAPHIRWVIQPEPTSVIDAIELAMPLCTGAYTFVLCADNTFDGDFILPNGCDSGFASRHVPWPQSQRFTRYSLGSHGVNLRLIPAESDEQGDGCWIGPLLLHTNSLATTLQAHRLGSHPIKTMAELIALSTGPDHRLAPVPMQCSDMGIPEEWEDRRAGERRTNE